MDYMDQFGCPFAHSSNNGFNPPGGEYYGENLSYWAPKGGRPITDGVFFLV